MTDFKPLCVECLRIAIDEYGASFRDPPSTYTIGSNQTWGNYHPSPAYYCVDGTYYCAEHSIEPYRTVRADVVQYMIEEGV